MRQGFEKYFSVCSKHDNPDLYRVTPLTGNSDVLGFERARLQPRRKPSRKCNRPARMALAIATAACTTVEERRFQRRVKRFWGTWALAPVVLHLT
jgi:hypothetical protein